jgi:hypothetical protein
MFWIFHILNIVCFYCTIFSWEYTPNQLDTYYYSIMPTVWSRYNIPIKWQICHIFTRGLARKHHHAIRYTIEQTKAMSMTRSAYTSERHNLMGELSEVLSNIIEQNGWLTVEATYYAYTAITLFWLSMFLQMFSICNFFITCSILALPWSMVIKRGHASDGKSLIIIRLWLVLKPSFLRIQ